MLIEGLHTISTLFLNTEKEKHFFILEVMGARICSFYIFVLLNFASHQTQYTFNFNEWAHLRVRDDVQLFFSASLF